MPLFFLACLLLCLPFCINAGYVKIAEGVDRPQAMGMSPDAAPLDYVPPARYYGPQSLYFLSKSCFKESIDRFEYDICPFQNITQKRINGHKTHLLGVWGYWDNEDDAHKVYDKMVYSKGQGCHSDVVSEDKSEGDLLSAVQVRLECGGTGPIKVKAISETSHCVFNMTLSVPISCHLLSNVPYSDLVAEL